MEAVSSICADKLSRGGRGGSGGDWRHGIRDDRGWSTSPRGPGVSTATASLVLRGRPGPSAATADAVRAAAAALGYRPDRTASLLARRRTHLLGVLLDVTSPFHAELVRALDTASADRGLDLVLSTTTARTGEHRAAETLLDFRCEAMVLLGPQMTDADLTALATTARRSPSAGPAPPG